MDFSRYLSGRTIARLLRHADRTFVCHSMPNSNSKIHLAHSQLVCHSSLPLTTWLCGGERLAKWHTGIDLKTIFLVEHRVLDSSRVRHE